MPNLLQKKNKVLISLGRVELFCLFVACSYTTMEATCYHANLVGYGPTYPKFSEITNRKYFWKGFILGDFVVFFQVVIFILLDIRWNYKNILFWVDTVRHMLSANQIVRYFKTKKWKTIWVTKLILCHHWSYKNYHAILNYGTKKLLANQFAEFFTFDLLDL